MIKYFNDFKDYQLLDCGDGYKLEKWGKHILLRPDPIAIWPKQFPNLWNKQYPTYIRSNKGGGYWTNIQDLPKHWIINFEDLKFKVTPTDFKHTGLFPEQAINWQWIRTLINKSTKTNIKVLNLFGYTGAASLAATSNKVSEIVHVDASKGAIAWAKENMLLSNKQNHCIRFIVDDCNKFVQREIRRNHKYDIIILDPPSYGRGPSGEMWHLESQLMPLLINISQLLSNDPIALLLNTYTTNLSNQTLLNCFNNLNLPKGILDISEIGIKIENSSLILPCGTSSRWSYEI